MKQDMRWHRDRKTMLAVCQAEGLRASKPSRNSRHAGNVAEGVYVSICGNPALRAMSACPAFDVIVEYIRPAIFGQPDETTEVWRVRARERAIRVARNLSARGVNCTLRLGGRPHAYVAGKRVPR